MSSERNEVIKYYRELRKNTGGLRAARERKIFVKKPMHPAVVEHYRKMGKKGGRARADKLSPKRRMEISRLGVLAREKKRLDRQEDQE